MAISKTQVLKPVISLKWQALCSLFKYVKKNLEAGEDQMKSSLLMTIYNSHGLSFGCQSPHKKTTTTLEKKQDLLVSFSRRLHENQCPEHHIFVQKTRL